jgi:hypothetical protein
MSNGPTPIYAVKCCNAMSNTLAESDVAALPLSTIVGHAYAFLHLESVISSSCMQLRKYTVEHRLCTNQQVQASNKA